MERGKSRGKDEDIILVHGMLARRCVMAFVTRCTVASMMPGRLAVPGWMDQQHILNFEAVPYGLGGQQLVLKLMVGLKGEIRQDELRRAGLQSALDP